MMSASGWYTAAASPRAPWVIGSRTWAGTTIANRIGIAREAEGFSVADAGCELDSLWDSHQRLPGPIGPEAKFDVVPSRSQRIAILAMPDADGVDVVRVDTARGHAIREKLRAQ